MLVCINKRVTLHLLSFGCFRERMEHVSCSAVSRFRSAPIYLFQSRSRDRGESRRRISQQRSRFSPFLRRPLSRRRGTREHVSRMTSWRGLAFSVSPLFTATLSWRIPLFSLSLLRSLFHPIPPNLPPFQPVSLSFSETRVFLEHSKNHDGTRCRFLSSPRDSSSLATPSLSLSLLAPALTRERMWKGARI